MLGGVKAQLARTLTTKVGLALVAALLLGGASAMAMATTHGQPFANGHIFSNNLGSSRSASPTAHGADDEDDTACTSASPTASTKHGDDGGDGDDHEGEATKAPGDHANPTKTAGDDADDDQGTDHEGTECEGSDKSPKATHAPEPTERPEGTHTPEPGGD